MMCLGHGYKSYNFINIYGEMMAGMCWLAPLHLTGDRQRLHSRYDVDEFAAQYVLLLPMMDAKGAEYTNKYYAIGSRWTERQSTGKFTFPELSNDVFRSWL